MYLALWTSDGLKIFCARLCSALAGGLGIAPICCGWTIVEGGSAAGDAVVAQRMEEAGREIRRFVEEGRKSHVGNGAAACKDEGSAQRE